MNSNTYKDLRHKVFEKLEANTVSLLFSGLSVRKSADASYPFFANRNFTYLTGIEEEAAILVLDKRNDSTILFIRDIDELKEKWMGYYIRPQQATELSGIEDVRYFSEFDAYMEQLVESDVLIGVDIDHDTEHEDIIASGLEFASNFDDSRIVDIQSVLTQCRMVKHEDEVLAIENALEVTNEAILAALSEMKPGNNENDIAARFQYEGMKRGGSLMFDTIIASGANAVVLHYIENDQPLVDGEMVLFDLGISVNRYGGDISRTFPVNGKFTEQQRAVYQEVLDCFHAVNQAIRPGVTLIDLNELAKEKLANSCKKLGLIESTDDVSNYYYHSIGHSLGLDTHDAWSSREAKLEVGNVITNEPGLYIKEWGIGVRIETDVLVTQDGMRDLAPYIIREVDEIEAFLNQ